MSASLSYPVSAFKPSSKARPKILILEPDLAVLDYLRLTLGNQYSLSLFSEEQTLLDRLEQNDEPDLLLLALHTNRDPLPLLTHIRCTKPHLPVIVLSCSAELRDLEMVIRLGVRAIVMKPFIGSDVEQAIEEHLASAEKKISAADTPREIPLNETHSFVRSSKRMRDLEAQAALVARADIPLLILGESGTGKEILALYTHKMSARSQRIFLKVNCAAVPADLLESELFGYEQGAFTGAVKTKPGKFEICSGGTIFLDEIGEMPAILQAKLLQVLQDGTFSRLGSRVADEGGCARDRCDQHQYEGSDGEQDLPRGPVLPVEWVYVEHSAASRTQGRDSGAVGVLHAQGGQEVWPRATAVLAEPAACAERALVAGQSARVGECRQPLSRAGRRESDRG